MKALLHLRSVLRIVMLHSYAFKCTYSELSSTIPKIQKCNVMVRKKLPFVCVPSANPPKKTEQRICKQIIQLFNQFSAILRVVKASISSLPHKKCIALNERNTTSSNAFVDGKWNCMQIEENNSFNI